MSRVAAHGATVTTAFTEQAEDLVLIAGTGKTHLAVALGVEAVTSHKSVARVQASGNGP